MSLQFLNASRAYDRVKQCITFWGHDSSFEISFRLGDDVLQHFSPHTPADENASLRVFDLNRSRIERAATAAYSKRRNTFLRLAIADF